MSNSNKHIDLRVCSCNIHKGVSALRAKPVLNELRQAIRSMQADVVCLQEITGQKLEQHSMSQFEFLADEVWSFQAYGKNAIYQNGHHGNAILSKYAFLEWQNVDVSRWQFSQRGILLGKLSMGAYIICVHFGLFQSERKQQLDSLKSIMGDQIPPDAPLIVTGDFNDWNRAIHRELVASTDLREAYTQVKGHLARTFPASFPLFRLDRIYYRDIDVVDAKVLSVKPWKNLSDHCGLYTTFRL